MSERKQISISVRRLVEFILRSGDISEGMQIRDTLESMQAGARIHKKLQSSAGSDYHAEVALSVTIDMGDYDLIVQGRADGIIYKEKSKASEKGIMPDSLKAYSIDKGFFPELKRSLGTGIDEIKGTYRDLRLMKEPDPLHIAQAKCYGFIFLFANNLNETDITVTYCNIDSGAIKRFTYSYSADQLREFFTDLVEKYRKWSDFSYNFSRESLDSIHRLRFPFDYRPGQFDLIASVYRSIEQKGLLFLMAPTGTGKTLSTIFPSLMAVGEGMADKIFYLTAKTMTARNAQNAFLLFKEKGYRGKTVSLTAKEKMCINDKMVCDPFFCQYAKGHFDRINDAMYQLLISEDIISRDILTDTGKRSMVCPYLLEYDLCDWCDNIIGDFNYVFDPRAYLKRFFAGDNSDQYIFLIDEAHNLPERGRRMYSASLSAGELFAVRKQVPKGFSKLRNRISQVINAIDKICTDRKGDFIAKDLDSLIPKLLRLKAFLDEFLDDESNRYDQIENLRQMYFNISFFLEIYEELDQRYVIRVHSEEKNSSIRLFCIDPSLKLQNRLDAARSSVLFSATLLPLSYYKNLSCTVEKPFAVYAKSSFSREKRLIIAGGGVTSLYKRRSDSMYARYAAYIEKIISSHKGNYLIFAPSYAIIEQISERMDKGKNYILLQTPEMTEDDRDGFLDEFKKERKTSLAAFAVAGGIFSEGIDLTGESLIGVIIAGVPLPQVNFTQTILSDYYDRLYGKGFDYAYLYPAVSKVLQSAGRLIRTENDSGVIALLDDRYLRYDYRCLFPREWDDIVNVTEENVTGIIEDFWKGVTDVRKENDLG